VVAAQLGANPLVLCWSLLFIGVAFAMHETRIRAFARRLPTAVVVLAYFAVTSFALFDLLPAVPTILGFGVATVLIIAKSLERGNVVSWLLTRPLLRALGRISYSFYLVHWMLVVLVARAVSAHVQELGGMGATLAIFGGGFIASAAVAAALWWLAERPYFAWVRRSRR
jgi:peptidoglycan/LPS O-acetylase OafA/YrhL